MEAFAVLIHELMLMVLDEGALDLIGGFVTQRDLHAVGDPAHVHLGDRGAFAGVKLSTVTMTRACRRFRRYCLCAMSWR